MSSWAVMMESLRAAEVSRLPMPWLQHRMKDDQLGFLRAVFPVVDSSVVHCRLGVGSAFGETEMSSSSAETPRQL
jgi:hypothetical protein